MNGVRRFFAATNVVAPSPSPPQPNTQDSAPPPNLPPIQTSFVSASSGKQVYPLAGSTSNSPAQSLSLNSPTSPGTAPAALFIKKDNLSSSTRKPVNADFKLLPSPPPVPSQPSYTNARGPVRSPPSPIGPSSTHPPQNYGVRSSSPPSWPVDASKQSNSTVDNGQKYTSTLVNPRDDLLISLLASEAAVDSRGFQILSSEEVDDLKREQQLLSSRIEAMKKKVALETKIRDAALSLQKLQTVKRLSKQTSEQVDAATRKVETATKELSRLLERANEIDRKLLEHRAGVLSFSLRNLEAKYSSETTSGECTEESLSSTRSGMTSRGVSSRTSSIASMSTRIKFDGAHLFAGHADSIAPGSTRRNAVSPSRLAALESKLQAAEEAAQAAEAKSSELQKQTQRLQLEKSEIETNLTMDLQTADETITKLEREISEMEHGASHRKEWERERGEWDLERRHWDAIRKEWEQERQALEDEVMSRTDNVAQLEERLEELASIALKEGDLGNVVSVKDDEIRRLRLNMDQQREDWHNQLVNLERQKQEEINKIRQEFKTLEVATSQLDTGRNILCEVVRSHKIPTSPSDTTIPSIASSLGSHIASLSIKVAQLVQEKVDLEASRRKYEEDVRIGFEIRERLDRELEQARQDREEAWREVRLLETRLKVAQELSNVMPSVPLLSTDANNVPSGEYTKLLTALRGIWSALPSVEARASKMGKSSSISDLDVRALKSLYDPKVGFTSPPVSGSFSVDAFVARVQALIADDRALIERLFRFAQAHDLLRNNAERAQKLAQDSNKGLEMYQVQVKALEERNANLSRKQLDLLDEVNSLHQSVDMVIQEKRELETQAIEYTQTIENLTEANNKLSARALAFAEEAATAPNALKAKLEAQLAEVGAKLKESQDEIDRIRSSESMQRVTLLDELNSLQQENGKLRDQLRKK
ncbi:Up-regulated during septation-domain-containing protein [Hysterangium stoloniferum]|nr:Up-regulated during septation-domain-containing protein [Hysterangium stoloniferum]